MKPHELIDALVESEGGSLPAAKAMNKPSFQGTLHKICKGGVLSPKRSSAERIANHYNIPVDAVYDARLAEQIYKERFPNGSLSVREIPITPEQERAVKAISSAQHKMIIGASGVGKSLHAVELMKQLGALVEASDETTRSVLPTLLARLAENPKDAALIGEKIEAMMGGPDRVAQSKRAEA